MPHKALWKLKKINSIFAFQPRLHLEIQVKSKIAFLQFSAVWLTNEAKGSFCIVLTDVLTLSSRSDNLLTKENIMAGSTVITTILVCLVCTPSVGSKTFTCTYLTSYYTQKPILCFCLFATDIFEIENSKSVSESRFFYDAKHLLCVLIITFHLILK